MKNVLNWFEIPATDFDRAKKFYASLFEVEDLHVMEMDGVKLGFLPVDMPENPEDMGVGGAVCHGEWYKPTADSGAIIYLNANPNLDSMLGRVQSAGGMVALPKTSIGEFGNMAIFIDSEGNRVGLHSMQ